MAELRRANVIIRQDEALAIVQALIEGSQRTPPITAPAPDSPSRPLSADRVFIAHDGSVSCVGCDHPLAVPDVAALFQALQPRNARISGSLRYALARARLDVDAPPFASLDDFSRALARHERSDRQAVLRGLVQRASPIGMKSSPFIERRRSSVRASDLRRELRDADARVYDQQLAIAALGAMVPVEPSRGRRGLFAVATVAAGLVLVGAGGAIWSRPSTPPNGVTTVDDRAVPERAVEPEQVAQPKPPAIEQPAPREGRQQRQEPQEKPEAAKPSVKRASNGGGTHAQHTRRQPQQRSRLDWLRSKIAFRVDPL